MLDRRTVSALLDNASSLPEACLLEHADASKRLLLRGRVTEILRHESEARDVENLNLGGLNIARSGPSPAAGSHPAMEAQSSSTETTAALPGMRRQASFHPPSMLTENEQRCLHARRLAAVEHLARVASPARRLHKTIRKIRKGLSRSRPEEAA